MLLTRNADRTADLTNVITELREQLYAMQAEIKHMSRRLTRIETRLCIFMEHFDVSPDGEEVRRG